MLLLPLCLQSCKAQVKEKIMYPIITKDFETFDNYRYEQLKQKDKFNTTEFFPNGNFFEMTSVDAGNILKNILRIIILTLLNIFIKIIILR